MATAKYEEKRKNVMVGNLPEDFLRVSPPNSGTSSPTSNGPSVQPVQQRNFGPHSAVSQITLCIVQAQLTKNYSLTKMDPYVRVRIGHTVYETHADVRSGKFPNWNKTITSYLPQGIKTIYIEVFDEHTITADERIAQAEYSLPEEALQGKFVDTWIPLNGRQGEGKEGSINITVYITSTPYSPMMSSAAPIMVVPQPAITPMPYYMSGRPVVQYPMVQPMINPNYAYPAVQQQMQCPPPPTEEDIKQLQEMFPSFDREVILGVLENSGRNKEQAISSLLSLSEK